MEIWNHKYSDTHKNDLLMIVDHLEDELKEFDKFFDINGVPTADEGGTYNRFFRLKLLLEKAMEYQKIVWKEEQQKNETKTKLVL
jgi:hypothetical protein